MEGNDAFGGRRAEDAVPVAVGGGKVPVGEEVLGVVGDGGFEGEERVRLRRERRACGGGRR